LNVEIIPSRAPGGIFFFAKGQLGRRGGGP
jgi:hypothetical protein